DVVLVVEGAARGVTPVPDVRVADAPGSGDDLIAGLVADESARRPCVVVTADRGLRDRVTRAGGVCVGPRTVYGPA
ncbi:NTP pyrophosphohydrolase, partial [Streptomyces sp. NPDC058953]